MLQWNGIPLVVLHGNPRSGYGVAQSDDQERYARFANRLGDLFHIRAMILAIGQNNDILKPAPIGIQHLIDHFFNGRQEHRTAEIHAARLHLRHHITQKVIVRSQGTGYRGAARVNYESHLFAIESIQAIANALLRRFQTRRIGILSQHASRHVQDEDDVPSGLRYFVPNGIVTGTREGKQGRRQHAEPYPIAPLLRIALRLPQGSPHLRPLSSSPSEEPRQRN